MPNMRRAIDLYGEMRMKFEFNAVKHEAGGRGGDSKWGEG